MKKNWKWSLKPNTKFGHMHKIKILWTHLSYSWNIRLFIGQNGIHSWKWKKSLWLIRMLSTKYCVSSLICQLLIKFLFLEIGGAKSKENNPLEKYMESRKTMVYGLWAKFRDHGLLIHQDAPLSITGKRYNNTVQYQCSSRNYWKVMQCNTQPF